MPPIDFNELLDGLDQSLKDYYEYCIWDTSNPNTLKKAITKLDNFAKEAFGPKTGDGTLSFMDTPGFSCVVICEKQHISERIISSVVRYYTPTTGDTIRPTDLMLSPYAHTNFTNVNNALTTFLDGNYIPEKTEVLYSILTGGIFLCPVAPTVGKDNMSLQVINDIVRFGVLLPYLFSNGGTIVDFKEPYSHIAELMGKTNWSEGDYNHISTYLNRIVSDHNFRQQTAIKHWCIFVVVPYDSFDTILHLVGLKSHPFIKRIIQIEEYPALLKNTIYVANTNLEKINTEIELSIGYANGDKEFLQIHHDFLLKYIDSHINSH